jgi:hypothetical protein
VKRKEVTMGENATCDYSVLLKGHQNKWIALSSDTKRVVAVADSAREAIAKAKESKENDPVLTKTSENNGALIV